MLIQTISLFALLLAVNARTTAQEEAASREELRQELLSRESDLARTNQRLQELDKQETAAISALDRTRVAASHLESVVSAKAKLLYLLCRRGGSLRYLLGSSSPVEMLRRANTLRRLVTEDFEMRRETGLRLAELESQLSAMRAERTEALSLRSLLEQTLSELRATGSHLHK